LGEKKTQQVAYLIIYHVNNKRGVKKPTPSLVTLFLKAEPDLSQASGPKNHLSVSAHLLVGFSLCTMIKVLSFLVTL
jgi:hypothetical protein